MFERIFGPEFFTLPILFSTAYFRSATRTDFNPFLDRFFAARAVFSSATFVELIISSVIIKFDGTFFNYLPLPINKRMTSSLY